jgi:hypothetical protein
MARVWRKGNSWILGKNIQSLCKTVQKFPKKLKIKLPLMDIHPREIKSIC